MTVLEILEMAFPIRISYSKKKVGRILNKRAQLKDSIDMLKVGPKVSTDILFAEWLRDNEYSHCYGRSLWTNLEGQTFTIQELHTIFLNKLK